MTIKEVNYSELYNHLKRLTCNFSYLAWPWPNPKHIQSGNDWLFWITKKLGVNLVKSKYDTDDEALEVQLTNINSLQPAVKKSQGRSRHKIIDLDNLLENELPTPKLKGK